MRERGFPGLPARGAPSLTRAWPPGPVTLAFGRAEAGAGRGGAAGALPVNAPSLRRHHRSPRPGGGPAPRLRPAAPATVMAAPDAGFYSASGAVTSSSASGHVAAEAAGGGQSLPPRNRILPGSGKRLEVARLLPAAELRAYRFTGAGGGEGAALSRPVPQ
ncbi:uncharacterized protein LJ264_012979 [Porphyrio hochstetteri]